jgi:hypothetical protein
MEITRVTLVWTPAQSGRRASTHLDFSWFGGEPIGASLQGIADDVLVSADEGAKIWSQIAHAGSPLLQVGAQNMETVAHAVTPSYPYGRRWSPMTVEYIAGPSSLTPTSAANPPGTSQLVSLYTPLPGRRRRGRVYLPPPADGEVDDGGQIEADNAAEAATFVEQLAQAALDSGSGAVLALHVVASLAANGYAGVVNYIGRRRLASQRRRQGP